MQASTPFSTQSSPVPVESLEPRRLMSAVAWNAAQNFSSHKNPNGVWSYGTSPSLTGAFATYATHEAVDINDAQVLEWHPSTSIFPVLYEGQYGTSDKGTGPLLLHPGINGEYCDVRFTVPNDGDYALAAEFAGADKATTDVHILNGTTTLFSDELDGVAGDTSTKTLTLNNLTKGTVLTFAVGYGTDKSESYDTTRLIALVNQTRVGPAVTTGIIAGTVYLDHNGDGHWNQTDAGMKGWIVYLDGNGNHQFDSGEKFVTTDSSGNWGFTLSPGTYDIGVQVRSGYYQTAPKNLDFDITVAAGQRLAINLFGVKTISTP